MKFRNILIGMLAIISLAACSKATENKTNRGAAAVGSPALVEGSGNNVSDYKIGTPNYTYSVTSGQLMVDGKTIQSIDSTTFSGFPVLAGQVADLASVNKVIATKENALELWSSDSLLLAWDIRSASPALLHSSKGGFEADHIAFVMSEPSKDQKQGLGTATLAIDMRECMAEQKQEQSKPVDQGKQGQDQGKPQQLCRIVSMSFLLTEVEQTKQQDQGKQSQDQGKATPAPAPIDQGKQGQDQGKATPAPAPIDQGKK